MKTLPSRGAPGPAPDQDGTQRSPGQPYTREIGPPEHILEKGEKTPEAVRRWHEDIVAPSGVSLIAGAWLLASPLALGYSDADRVWVPLAFGGLIALLALGRLTVLKTRPAPSWINALLGAWLFTSGFVLQDSAAANLNEAISGAVVFLAAVVSAEESEFRRARARYSRS